MENMYIVTKELSSDSQEYRLEFYFQETSEGIAVTLLDIHGLSLGLCQSAGSRVVVLKIVVEVPLFLLHGEPTNYAEWCV